MLNLKRIMTPSGLILGLLSVGIFSVSAGAAQKSKSYEVSLNTAMKAGTQVLAAGDYKLRLEGLNAVFTKEGNKATFTIPAKVEAGDTKFDQTIILVDQNAGQPRITSIKLAGGKNVLKLN